MKVAELAEKLGMKPEACAKLVNKLGNDRALHTSLAAMVNKVAAFEKSIERIEFVAEKVASGMEPQIAEALAADKNL